MGEDLNHDGYIEAAPEGLRPLLSRVRLLLKETLPEAEEVMMYGMPGFAAGGKVVVGYGAFSKTCGLYVSKGAIAAHAEAIAAAGLKASKTGVTFSPAKPLPDALVHTLARTAWSEQA